MPESHWWGSPRSLAALCVIVAASAAVRLYLFAGFVGLDDAEYARFAYRMAHGTYHLGDYTGPAVFPLRIGLVVPTALLFRFFGLSEWSMVAYPFALSLLGIILIYLLTSLWFGHRAGLLAAALLGAFPWDIDGATKLVPDLPAAFFAAAAITVIAWALRADPGSRSRTIVAGLLAGLCLGLSWLCKETVAYLAPFAVAWAALSTRRHGLPALVLWGGVAAGSLSVLLSEMVVYHSVTGDFLFRLHQVERNYRQWENSFFTEGSDFGWPRGTSHTRALLHRLFVGGPAFILLNRSLLFLPLLGIGVTVYAWFRRERAFLVPGIWLWTLVLMFNFSSSSTTTYLPLALFNRYLSPIFFPAISLVAGFLDRAVLAPLPGRPARWAGWAVASFLIWVGGIGLLRSLRSPSTWLSEIPVISEYIQPQTNAYADALSLRALEFFEHYPPQTAWKDLDGVTSAQQVAPGSLVLINPAHIQWLDRNAGMWVAWPVAGPTNPTGYARSSFYRNPPESWKPIWQRGNVLVYRVAEHDSRTPEGGRGP